MIRTTIDGAVATVTLDRPEKRNALALSFWDEFPAEIERLDAGGDVRAIVVAGEGPAFCAGIDLAVLADAAAGEDLGAAAPADFMQRVALMQRTFSVLEDARIPVIAAVHGKCYGAGVDLVTACDIRLASEDAAFSVYEINVGMTADVGTFPRLCHLLPEGIVRELSYTGREMRAEEAQHFGFVNRVLPDAASVRTAAQELAAEIATKAPLAIFGCKRAITYARDHTTRDSLERIGIWNASMLQKSEVMAAMAAKQTGTAGAFAQLPVARTKLSD